MTLDKRLQRLIDWYWEINSDLYTLGTKTKSTEFKDKGNEPESKNSLTALIIDGPTKSQ